MKPLTFLAVSVASTFLAACHTTKVDDHSMKYVTNYNTMVQSKPQQQPQREFNTRYEEADETTSVIPRRNYRELTQRNTVIRELSDSDPVTSLALIEPPQNNQNFVPIPVPSPRRQQQYVPMAGVMPTPRANQRFIMGFPPAPQLYFYSN